MKYFSPHSYLGDYGVCTLVSSVVVVRVLVEEACAGI
jgi:hypothetical protein